jgi:hypothetical protein
MRLNREQFLVALLAFEAAGATACSKDRDGVAKEQTGALGTVGGLTEKVATNPARKGFTPVREGGVPPVREGGVPPVREGGVPPVREGGVPPVREGGVPPTREGSVPPTREGGGPVTPVNEGGPPRPPPPPVAPPPGQRRIPVPTKR